MNEFVSVAAAKIAVGDCKTLENLKLLDEQSVKLLNKSPYKYRVEFYQLMFERSNLILDSMGEGVFAEMSRSLLNK